MIIPAISLNAVVKNEERIIGKMLSSVEGLVKEMVIVDTGSTDNTVNICKEFGATVIEYPVNKWTGTECVKVRQMALDATTKPWVLMLDGDEELSQLLDSEIRTFIHQNQYDCLKLRRVNFLDKKPNYVDGVARLFRNGIGYRWWINPTDGAWFEEISLTDDFCDPGHVKNSTQEIYHFGWWNLSDDKLDEKQERYKKTGHFPFVEKVA